MYRLKVEQMLKEYNDYKPGDLVRINNSYGRIFRYTEPDAYDIDVATPEGIMKKRYSKNQFSLSYPIEFAMNWDGKDGNRTDILTDEEWNDLKANHPVIYEDCLRKVASNTDYGSMIENWVFKFLMSDKNTLNGKPGTVIGELRKANYGPIMKYARPGEELNDTIIRLKKEAVYVTPDNKHVFMSY